MNLTLWITAGRCLTGRQRQTTQLRASRLPKAPGLSPVYGLRNGSGAVLMPATIHVHRTSRSLAGQPLETACRNNR